MEGGRWELEGVCEKGGMIWHFRVLEFLRDESRRGTFEKYPWMKTTTDKKKINYSIISSTNMGVLSVVKPFILKIHLQSSLSSE
jgi:hypothetical protein